MDWFMLARWLHVIGACVLLGTGAGIAFFMVMARSRSARSPIPVRGIATTKSMSRTGCPVPPRW
jgi:uncharacterized membrane protein